MATIFSKRRLRLPLDLGSFDTFRDQVTGQTPDIWRGNGVQLEIGAFLDLRGSAPASDEDVVDVDGSGWESLTVEVKATPTTVENVMAKTVIAFDNSLTVATWEDKTKSHAVVEFTAEETNIAAGNYHMVVSVLTTAGDPITLGVSTLTVREDGAHLTVAAPPVNPGDAMTLGQGDARYAPISVSGRFSAIAFGDNNAVSVESATLTPLSNWVDEHDPASAHTAGVVPISRSGVYLISGGCVANDEPEGMYEIELWAVSGTQQRQIRSINRGTTLEGCIPMHLTSPSTVQLHVRHTSDTSKEFYCETKHTFSVIELIAD